MSSNGHCETEGDDSQSMSSSLDHVMESSFIKSEPIETEDVLSSECQFGSARAVSTENAEHTASGDYADNTVFIKAEPLFCESDVEMEEANPISNDQIEFVDLKEVVTVKEESVESDFLSDSTNPQFSSNQDQTQDTIPMVHVGILGTEDSEDFNDVAKAVEINLAKWYRKNPLFYDKSLTSYREPVLKQDLLTKKAKTIGTTVDQIKEWYKDMRSQYTRIFGDLSTYKIKSSSLSPREMWIWKTFDFLKGHIKPHPNRCKRMVKESDLYLNPSDDAVINDASSPTPPPTATASGDETTTSSTRRSIRTPTKRRLDTVRILHSKRLNDSPLEPWLVVLKDGLVRCCQCTCSDDTGESCSHITALLPAVEKAKSELQSRPLPSVSCDQLKPSSKEPDYIKGTDIFFTPEKSKAKRAKLDHDQGDELQGKKEKTQIFEDAKPSKEELSAFYAELYASYTDCAFLSVLPGHWENSSPYSIKNESKSPTFLRNAPKVLITKKIQSRALTIKRMPPETWAGAKYLPQSLSQLYDRQHTLHTLDELRERSQFEFKRIAVTPEQITAVEVETRPRASSDTWFRQRAGRITASNFMEAAKTDPSNPSKYLIKNICYPLETYNFNPNATQRNCEHEEKSVDVYQELRKCHKDFERVRSGFHIHAKYPYLGAAPDGLISCECCGKGCFKIKCPYCLDNTQEHQNFCMTQDDDGALMLKRDHKYYYQVQALMAATETEYCDFVVWSEQTIVIERIKRDNEFFETQVEKVKIFYIYCILPELLGKYFSRTLSDIEASDHSNYDDTETMCYCQSPVESLEVLLSDPAKAHDILICGSKRCRIKKFHKSCLAMKNMPKTQWYCIECKSIMKASLSKIMSSGGPLA